MSTRTSTSIPQKCALCDAEIAPGTLYSVIGVLERPVCGRCFDRILRMVLIWGKQKPTPHSSPPHRTCWEKIKRLEAEKAVMLEVLETAKQFISNGIELGYIHLPEEGDAALETPAIIEAAIGKAEVEE